MAKVRKRKSGTRRITAAAAFRAGDDDALRAALKLKPWEWPSPLGIEDVEPCPYPAGTAAANWWPECLALRAALIEAASSPKQE